MSRLVSSDQFVSLPAAPYSVPHAGLSINGQGQKVSVTCASNMTASFAGYVVPTNTQSTSVEIRAYLRVFNNIDPLVATASRGVSVLLSGTDPASVTPILGTVLLPGTYYVEVMLSAPLLSTGTAVSITAAGQLSITTVAA